MKTEGRSGQPAGHVGQNMWVGPYPIQHIVVAPGADSPWWICGHLHLVRGNRQRSRGVLPAGGGGVGGGLSWSLTRMVLSVDVVYKVPSECLIPVI